MFRKIGALITVLLLGFAVSAYASKPKVLAISDVKSGTKAIGFSVFSGTEPQEFNVALGELVIFGGNTFILARVSGGPLEVPLEKFGAIPGMSGSPVFIGCSNYDECIRQGTLVGSISYRLGSMIAGGINSAITPAVNMLGAKPIGLKLANSTANIELKPLEIISRQIGLEGSNEGICQPLLEDKDLKPGSMISIDIVKGDVPVKVSGTVTWRDDDLIYAFGHMMFGSGRVFFSFSQARVAATLMSEINPTKITGCSVGNEGVIVLDGPTEVVGIAKRRVRYSDFNINVTAAGRQFQLRSQFPPFFNQRQDMMIFLERGWFRDNFGDALYQYPISYRARISILNQPEVFLRGTALPDTGRESKTSTDQAFERVFKTLSQLENSKFDFVLQGIQVDAEVIDKFKVWTKEKIEVNGQEVTDKPINIKAKPGEKFNIALYLSDQTKSSIKKIEFPVTIPSPDSNKSDGNITLNISLESGSTLKSAPTSLDKYPYTLEKLITDINSGIHRSDNQVYIKVSLKKPDSDFKDKKQIVEGWQEVAPSTLSRELAAESKNDEIFSLPPLEGIVGLKESLAITVEDTTSKSSAAVTKDNPVSKKNKKFLGLF